MKRKFNNSGRQVRPQEEIEARREARRKYYEELDAFERDLPDFIFTEDQTDADGYYFDEEDEEEDCFFGKERSFSLTDETDRTGYVPRGADERTGGDDSLIGEEGTPAFAVGGRAPGRAKKAKAAGKKARAAEGKQRAAVTEAKAAEGEQRAAVTETRAAEGEQRAAAMEARAAKGERKAAIMEARAAEEEAEAAVMEAEAAEEEAGAEALAGQASEEETSRRAKKRAGASKGGKKNASSKGKRRSASSAGTKRRALSDTETRKRSVTASGKKRSGRKRRRRRRNIRRYILAASVAAVLLGGGLFGVHALGIIGGRELYEVYINDTLVGKVLTPEEGQETYLRVRREVVSNSESMVLMEAECDIRKVETIVKLPSDTETLQENMKQAMEESIVGTLDKAYTVKINDYVVNLKDKTEVVELLEAVKSPYDEENEYSVQLVADTSKELTMLTTQVVKTEDSQDIAGVAVKTETADEAEADISAEEESEAAEAGAEAEEGEEQQEEEQQEENTLPESTGENDGLKTVSFVEDIEVVESYVPQDNITSVEEAVSDITKEKEENKIYEAVSGDCLSIVAEKNDMSMAKLLELNEDLDEDTVIQIGDEIVVTAPEPELSVITQEEVSYEEDYEAEVQYIDNDSWYTTKEVVQQEASTGHRRVTALVTYKNGKETGREIIAETIITEAMPKIIERGTQTPPTYVKPISGGRLSSGYGKRWGRMHKGVDWACSVGTAVKASCGGTVASAGWSSSYGYVITISHPDGRQTRYAHLSKILVKAGQTVKQGDKIALSGNTGRSTGPHLHFEILINGSQVNPLKYLN